MINSTINSALWQIRALFVATTSEVLCVDIEDASMFVHYAASLRDAKKMILQCATDKHPVSNFFVVDTNKWLYGAPTRSEMDMWCIFDGKMAPAKYIPSYKSGGLGHFVRKHTHSKVYAPLNVGDVCEFALPTSGWSEEGGYSKTIRTVTYVYGEPSWGAEGERWFGQVRYSLLPDEYLSRDSGDAEKLGRVRILSNVCDTHWITRVIKRGPVATRLPTNVYRFAFCDPQKHCLPYVYGSVVWCRYAWKRLEHAHLWEMFKDAVETIFASKANWNIERKVHIGRLFDKWVKASRPGLCHTTIDFYDTLFDERPTCTYSLSKKSFEKWLRRAYVYCYESAAEYRVKAIDDAKREREMDLVSMY